MNPVLRRARRLLVRGVRAWEAEVRARARRRPILTDTVLYESFGGNGALDNPEALFRRLLERDDLAGLTHVWALGPGHAAFRREFRGHPRVRIVRYRSSPYFRVLSRAGWLVNNATFPPEWGKRDGQLYLNTWHGTPLKHMGYDMAGGALQAANVLRNLLAADVLLSQSAWMTRTMYRDAYRLDGIFRGRILELGYPRTDRQVLGPIADAELRATLGARSRPLVVYAPTWSGESFARPRDEADAQLGAVRTLQSLVGDTFAVRMKAHQSVHALVSAHPDAAELLIDNDIPTNRILGVTDHLITDFSSIFFDYLAADRPITFYQPAGSPYRSERGAYFADDELPGAVLHDLGSVAARILDTVDPLEDRRRAWARRFADGVDGGAADRVIDAVFGNSEVAVPVGPTRRSLLVYLGGMRSNGITSSALNLLRAIDHDDWDVTALLARPGRSQRRNQAAIDPRVRQVFRIGGMNGTKWEVLRTLLRQRLRPRRAETSSGTRLWRDEWRRLFGDARFDVVIDFSGYSRFWTQLLLHSPDAHRMIWLHNDMASEVHRRGAGRRPVHGSLPGVLWLLRRFDALVSVSPRLAELNRERLAGAYAIPGDRFRSARNLIDATNVRTRAAEPVDSLPEVTSPDPDVDPIGAAEWRPPPWVGELTDGGRVRFVTTGRLSPEKNQSRLIAAFDRVHAEHPESRLLVIGDGPLRTHLESEVAARGLEDAVAFTGALANPFPVMAAADCFVLSSDYEGQPMVMLEAATIGLPIIATDFASSRDALPAGAARVVAMSEEALAGAMSAFVESPWAAPRFDAEGYNAACIREVEEVLRVDPRGSSDSSSASSSASAPASASSTTAPHTTPTTRTSAPPAITSAQTTTASDPRTAIHRLR